LALADHDSVEGISEANAAAFGTSVMMVPAVELSSVSKDGRDVHILGYFIDPADASLLSTLSDLRAARVRRAEAMVGALTSAGFVVSLDDVRRFSSDGAMGRSHVARALVSAGHAETVSDAFDRFIGRGRPYYVSKDVRSPALAIRCIRQAGGFAVVAHPGITHVDDLIEELIAAGLRGVEAYHAEHSHEQRAHYASLAAARGLLATGGSDYHGPDAPNASLGSVTMPDEALRSFMRAGRL
jgi:predicted metal-dependent phosphoesterase TrpH